MESQQTPRSSEDPVMGRGSPMVKQNPLSAGPGFQIRPQGHPPLSPRYPVNNGSVGAPRLGGQQAPTLHRLDSRSSLGSPTGPGGQFLQPRPPFGPPRPQTPQGNQIQGTRPPPPSNPQGLQGAPRYPGVPGSPNIRPSPNNLTGPRPHIYNTNQPQQIYYQPRIGEIRSQRPINQEPGAPPQIRFAPSPHNPETRHPAPQIIPDTVVTPPARNDWTLRDGRANNQSADRNNTRNFTNDQRSQPLTRQGHPRDKMEVIDSRSSTPGVQEPEPNRGNVPEENDNIPKRKPSPRAENQNEDDDDDDVVMDREKELEQKIAVPEKISNDTLEAEIPRVDSPSSPASANSYKKSPSPSPIPPIEIQDRPDSAIKVESSDEPPGEKLSNAASPVPFEDKSRETSRSESRLDDSPHAVGVMSEDSKHSRESLLKVGASDVEDNADITPENRSESRSSSIQSSRSPIPPRTPDHLATLSVPGSASPQLHDSPISPKSPKSEKSPQGSVKGFDNGQLRSLSPKSPTPSVSPASPNSPNSPAIPKSADGEKKKTTFANNSEPQVDPQIDTEEAKDDVTEKSRPMTPGGEAKGKPPTPSKVFERTQSPGTPDGRKSSMKRSTSGRSIKSDAGSDSGANQTNQGTPTTNGVSVSPTKKLPSKSREGEKRTTAASPVKSPSKSVKSLPRTPEAGPPSTTDKKKVPMNKVQVGAAPSPNLKTVRSKIGSLDNASYKPGGGKVKIENRKLDFSKAQPKIAAKNDKYMPSGGDKKITQVKLQWNAKPKVGSLDNATYKPGGGDKKIETVKLDFKDKAKPKVGSKDNAKHVPGGGTVKSSATPPKTPQDPPNDIETQKIDIKAESKIGSLDNVKHKPGGGDKKIFNDRDYLRQTGSNVESLNGSGAQIQSPIVAERPSFIEMKSNPPEPNPPPTTPTRSRPSSAVSPVTPRALRTSLHAKSPESPTAKAVSIDEESPSSTRKNSIAKGHQTPIRSKTPSSPGSSRPSSSSDTKSNKSPKSSRKTSPTGLHLPKLVTTQLPDNSDEATPTRDSAKIKLPKLLETSTLSSRVELSQ